MSRRLWLLALLVYALAAVVDAGRHLSEHRREGGVWLSPAILAVAVSAGLFWPIDIVAQPLLAR